VGRVVLVVRLTGLRLLGGEDPDHGDAPSLWLRRGRYRACLVPVVRGRLLGPAVPVGRRWARYRPHGSAGRSRTDCWIHPRRMWR
jgi:hypothetical protein